MLYDAILFCNIYHLKNIYFSRNKPHWHFKEVQNGIRFIAPIYQASVKNRQQSISFINNKYNLPVLNRPEPK